MLVSIRVLSVIVLAELGPESATESETEAGALHPACQCHSDATYENS
jgi:hypothetical protein